MKKWYIYIALAAACAAALFGCAGVGLTDTPSLPQSELMADNTASDTGIEGSGPEEQGYTVIPATEGKRTEDPPDAVGPTEEKEQRPPTADPKTEKIRALLDAMTLEERVAQMFFVGCPTDSAAEVLAQYPLGGYILFASHLANQTADEARAWIASLQEASEIPLLIGVDEEGGTVVRVSANPELRAERFASPRKLFAEGGYERIAADAQEKSALLLGLGINVNLAPVCDLGFEPNDFIYDRSFGSVPEEVSRYVSTVVTEMKAAGIGSVLKHFPGYGAAADTHTGIAVDNSTASDILDAAMLPFAAGVEADADAVMVCHNIVTAFDDAQPASLSPAIHELLRETLGMDVVVMTDDLDMGGIREYTDGASAAVQAVLAGNDMLLTSDYAANSRAVLDAVADGTIREERINESVARILAWKISLGLIKV